MALSPECGPNGRILSMLATRTRSNISPPAVARSVPVVNSTERHPCARWCARTLSDDHQKPSNASKHRERITRVKSSDLLSVLSRAGHSKSRDLRVVRVRPPPPAPDFARLRRASSRQAPSARLRRASSRQAPSARLRRASSRQAPSLDFIEVVQAGSFRSTSSRIVSAGHSTRLVRASPFSGTVLVPASSRHPATTFAARTLYWKVSVAVGRPCALRPFFLAPQGKRLLVLLVSFSNFASYKFRRRFFVRLSLVQTLSSSIMVNALRASRGASNKPSFI